MNHIILLGLVTLAAYFVDVSRAKLCFPDQWHGFIDSKTLDIMPQSSFLEMNMYIVSDARNLRKAKFVNYTFNGGVTSHELQVSLYDKSGKGVTKYEVDLDNNVCYRTVDKKAIFDRICLPADAEYLGHRLLGIDRYRGVEVTDWGYQEYPMKKVVSVIHFGNDFIPIHMTAIDSAYIRLSDVVGYDYTRGIDNPNVFDIPKQCLQAVVEHPSDTSLLRRFQFSELF